MKCVYSVPLWWGLTKILAFLLKTSEISTMKYIDIRFSGDWLVLVKPTHSYVWTLIHGKANLVP